MVELLEPTCPVTYFVDELAARMRTLPVPSDPVARLWHSATMLREHRGDGHVAALVGEGIGGTEARVLTSLDMGIHPRPSSASTPSLVGDTDTA